MANTNTKPAAAKSSLNLSEGTRQSLAMYGYAISAATGEMLVGTGSEDARIASDAEYKNAVKAYQNKMNQAKESTLR